MYWKAPSLFGLCFVTISVTITFNHSFVEGLEEHKRINATGTINHPKYIKDYINRKQPTMVIISSICVQNLNYRETILLYFKNVLSSLKWTKGVGFQPILLKFLFHTTGFCCNLTHYLVKFQVNNANFRYGIGRNIVNTNVGIWRPHINLNRSVVFFLVKSCFVASSRQQKYSMRKVFTHLCWFGETWHKMNMHTNSPHVMFSSNGRGFL